MRRSVIALVMITSLAFTGCLSDTSSTNSDIIDKSVKDKIISLESERVRQMLSNRDYEDYSIGGMGSFEVDVVSRSSDRVLVAVSIPYSYTYNKYPAASDRTKTVTPVSITADATETSEYLITEDNISRRN